MDKSWPTQNKLMRDLLAMVNSGKGKLKEFQTTVPMFNIGNSCFMSTMIECLANTPKFYDLYKDQTYKDHLSTNPQNDKLVPIVSALINNIWTKPTAVLPTAARAQIGQLYEETCPKCDQENENDQKWCSNPDCMADLSLFPEDT